MKNEVSDVCTFPSLVLKDVRSELFNGYSTLPTERIISREITTTEHKHRQSARFLVFSPTGNIGGPIKSFFLFLDAGTFSLLVLTAGIMVVIADCSRTMDDGRKQDVIQ